MRAVCTSDADKAPDAPHSPVSTSRSNVLGLGSSTWLRLAKQEKLHPYNIVKAHKLEQADYPRRLAMCQYLVYLTQAQLENILFSGEAQFDSDGTVNSQNVRHFAPRKGSLPAGQRQGRPGHFRQQKTNFPQKVLVFLGVRGNGTIFGYTKIEGGSLNSQRNHSLLQNRMLPDVRAGNGGTLQGLTWQQDGAPPNASDQSLLEGETDQQGAWT